MQPPLTRGGDRDAFTVGIEEVTHKSVSVAVIRMVAAYTGHELDELPSLAEQVDPEALDTIIEPALNDPAVVNTAVSFHYYGFEITVSSAGEIHLRACEETSE